MNLRNLALLGLAIASMLMLNWLNSDREAIHQDNLLFPALKENLLLLDKIEIKTFPESFTLLRKGEDWVLVEKYDYPVDFPALSKLLNGLSVARLIEKKTSKPENFAALRLKDVSDEDSDSILVSAIAPDFQFSVLVGKQALSRSAQFIRIPDQNQVWLIDEELDVGRDMISWLNPIVINIESEKITSVKQYDASGSLLFHVELPDDKAVGEGASLTLKDIPSGRSLKYPSITDELARSLVNVRFTDVSLHQPSRWKSPVKMVFGLNDGGSVSVTAEQMDGKRWLHLAIRDTQAGSGTIDSWDYEVSSYVFDDYTKELDDLLEDDPQDNPEDNPE